MHCVIVVITVFIALVSLSYFYIFKIYSAIQPQVSNKLSTSIPADPRSLVRIAVQKICLPSSGPHGNSCM